MNFSFQLYDSSSLSVKGLSRQSVYSRHSSVSADLCGRDAIVISIHMGGLWVHDKNPKPMRFREKEFVWSWLIQPHCVLNSSIQNPRQILMPQPDGSHQAQESLDHNLTLVPSRKQKVSGQGNYLVNHTKLAYRILFLSFKLRKKVSAKLLGYMIGSRN